MNLSLSNSNPLSKNRLWRTQAFLTRTHSEKRDSDPWIFLARSASHYSLSWTQAFLTRTHSVETDCEELKPFWLELILRNVTVILGYSWPYQPLIIDLTWTQAFLTQTLNRNRLWRTQAFLIWTHSEKCYRDPGVFMNAFREMWLWSSDFSAPVSHLL